MKWVTVKDNTQFEDMLGKALFVGHTRVDDQYWSQMEVLPLLMNIDSACTQYYIKNKYNRKMYIKLMHKSNNRLYI